MLFSLFSPTVAPGLSRDFGLGSIQLYRLSDQLSSLWFVCYVAEPSQPARVTDLLVAQGTSLAKMALLQQMRWKPAAAMTPKCRGHSPLEERAAMELGKDVLFRASSLFLRPPTSSRTFYRAVQLRCPGVHAETHKLNG